MKTTLLTLKKLLSVVTCVFLINTGAAQTETAPTEAPLFSDDYGISKEIEILETQKQKEKREREFIENFTKAYANSRQVAALPDTSCIVTIPVVFHVYHPQGNTGVPLSQIDFAVKDLNITFGGKDLDYTTVNATFAGVKSYTKIRFARALIDPKGNPTTGVIYYKDKQSGYGNGTGWDNEIGTCAWDNSKYMNVYVMNDLYATNVTNNSGVAWYPSTAMSNINTARVVYNYFYLGSGGSSFNNLEFNQTFTHECGHYLNLAHTFDGNSCTGTGDFCNDTPPTNISGGGCNAMICSSQINGENYLDYNSTCYKNFTMDQNTRMEAALLTPSRYSIWQYDNLVATGVLNPASTNTCVNANKFFSYSKTKLEEDIINTGSIEMPPVVIFACGGATFISPNTTLTLGVHYAITNVPAGLSVSIVTSANSKSATLTVSGSAASHAALNSITNMQLTFNNAAVVGGNASTILNYTKTFSIKFKDPWQKICVTPNITTTSSNSWNSLQTQGAIPRRYGLWYNAGAYYLENYGRGIITTGLTSDNIVFLPVGTTVGPASAWRAGGNQGLLYSPAYTALNGLTGYVGFRMQAVNDYFYGWMRISVSSTGGVTLLEYQYSQKPNDPIVVGSPCSSMTGIDIMQKPSEVMWDVFPNPSNGDITILLPEQEHTVLVSDVLGREVLKHTNVSKRLNLTIENDGIYFVTVQNGTQTSTKKIIVCK